jgi:hypothetical protein
VKIADLSGIETLIPNLAALFNIEPATALLLAAIASTICNVVSRLIPDTATGWLRTVKSICSIIGVHVPNRVAPATRAADVAADAIIAQVEHRVPPQVKEYFDSVAKKREEEVESDRAG